MNDDLRRELMEDAKAQARLIGVNLDDTEALEMVSRFYKVVPLKHPNHSVWDRDDEER